MRLRGDDLFGLANSLAELLGAPVTIEDPETTVLAYSGSADQAVDDVRVGTILARRVPLRWREQLSQAGVFDRLLHEDDIVYVDLAEEMTPRSVIAVRGDGELLGSIWAATGGPPSEDQKRALRAAVPPVSRLLARERGRLDTERRRRAEVVESILAGGSAATSAAAELDLAGEVTVTAFAAAVTDDEPPAVLLGAVDLHLGAFARRYVAAELSDVVYAVTSASEQTVSGWVREFLGRFRQRDDVVAGIGRPARSAAEAYRSRDQADEVVRALQRFGRRGVVRTVAEALPDLLASRVAGVFDDIEDITPLATLRAYDLKHGGDLEQSVQAYLAYGGEVSDAAAALHVHPNTLRNRLRRAESACGVAVDDPDVRLVLALQLRLADRTPGTR